MLILVTANDGRAATPSRQQRHQRHNEEPQVQSSAADLRGAWATGCRRWRPAVHTRFTYFDNHSLAR